MSYRFPCNGSYLLGTIKCCCSKMGAHKEQTTPSNLVLACKKKSIGGKKIPCSSVAVFEEGEEGRRHTSTAQILPPARRCWDPSGVGAVWGQPQARQASGSRSPGPGAWRTTKSGSDHVSRAQACRRLEQRTLRDFPDRDSMQVFLPRHRQPR